MGSIIVDDEDLIDLEDGGVVGGCVSRGASREPEASPEELEHLLDVCPPKLEQKLSLSRRQDTVHDCPTNGDVLVTLGHDQLVPRRKRIDVVSSETIKRIRDITKNLEPVLRTSDQLNASDDQKEDKSPRKNRDCVDAASADEDFSKCPDLTYETQAINSAFDFLSELDDDDDDQPPDKKRRRNSDHDKGNDESPPFSYPLEPTCLINDKTTKFQDIDRANRQMETNDKTFVIEPEKDRSLDENHENIAFERSSTSKNRFDTEDMNYQPEYDSNSTTDNFEHTDRGRPIERLSWSEGENHGFIGNEKNSTNFERSSNAREIDRLGEPSTSNGITTFLRRSSKNFLRRSFSRSVSSSECSEVDWSWVEEYDKQQMSPCQMGLTSSSHPDISGKIFASKCQSGKKALINKAPNNSSMISMRACSAAPTSGRTSSSCASSVSDGASAGCGENWKRGSGAVVARDFRASTAMSVAGTGKSCGSSSSRDHNSLTSNDFDICDDRRRSSTTNIEYDATSTSRFDICQSLNEPRIVRDASGRPVDVPASSLPISAGRSSGRRNGARGSSNSWLRASMRRIRHLRLPDTERNVPRRLEVDSTTALRSGPNSLPDIALIAPEILAAQTNGTVGNSGRPSSAPVASRAQQSSRNAGSDANTPRRGRRHASRSRTSRSQERNANNQSAGVSARASVNGTNNGTGATSENTEIGVQTGVSAATSPRRPATGSTQHNNSPVSNSNQTRRICERQRGVDRDNERGGDDDEEDESPLGRWPHDLSPTLAYLGCTLGLFNISRFAILSIQFGANFIVQFLLLSFILGIPLLTLQVCLGQRLSAGAVDMWRISPVFHGVGIALLVAQAFIGIYSIIGVSWMFVYFRDSFITKQDRYRWAEPFLLYRDDTRILHNTTTYKLHETVPDYFSGVVLQRHHLNEPDPGIVTLKFQVAFNLAVVWMIVFVSLSKGLRSYGKVVYVFTLVPVFGTLILCTKLIGLARPGSINQLFPATVWSEFFIISQSWVAASSEVFLTWGLLGAAAMQVAAQNKHKHLLQRDTTLVVVFTLLVLLLSAFLANTCVQILRNYGYVYTTSSFERISGYSFLRHANQPSQSPYSNTPERFMSHASFLLGQRVIRPGADLGTESGYQALRLSTELVPATFAILGTEQVSPFWAVLFYFTLILFGIAQQLAIWHCVITGIMAINTKMTKLWETTITFFSCACAYILGLPMATELGIYVVYYLDYTVGGAWWIMILYLVQVGAVFAVRGRPHTGETVVAELFPPTGRCLRHWAGPLLSFTWNVILPVALMVLSITVFKSSSFRGLYVYRKTSRDYWDVWVRQLGAAIQLTPILIVPGVAIIQTCRYLNSGPPDIFDRIQLLYRPPLDADGSPSRSPTNYGNDTSTSIHGNGILPSTTDVPFEDPPPKYTPPPSYTTATGARIAKMLRQSFRRSVRRIANVLGETSAPRTRPALQPPPPDYATVLVEMNQSVLSRDVTIHEPRPDVTDTRNFSDTNHERHRPNTIDRMTRISTIDRSSVERTHSTMDRGRARIYNNLGTSNLTAADVANLLRSSIRRGASRTQPNLCGINDLPAITTSMSTTSGASVENLVNAAVPISEDSLVCDKDLPLVERPNDDEDDEMDDEDDDNDEKKTVNEMDNSVSVI